VLVDPATAKEERVVYARDDYDIAGVEFSKKRKVMTLATWTSWHVERTFFDAETERTFASLGKLLPGKELIIQSSTDDEEQMVVAAFDDRTQGTRYLYDRKADKLDQARRRRAVDERRARRADEAGPVHLARRASRSTAT
jgi:hypothetical protein